MSNWLKFILPVFIVWIIKRPNLLGNTIPNSGFFAPVMETMVERNDSWGNGYFGASRDGGTRAHKGWDLESWPNRAIYSPISGHVNRSLQVYADDPDYIGCEITGTGQHSNFRIKIFYMTPSAVGQYVEPGQFIGYAQSISEKYPGMQDHIHIEVYENGTRKDPAQFFQSFA